MEVDFLESQVINESPESTHHFPVIIGIIFIFYLVNQVKVPINIQGPVQTNLIYLNSSKNIIFSSLPCGPYTQVSHQAVLFSKQN
jgi:hypothetical protein